MVPPPYSAITVVPCENAIGLASASVLPKSSTAVAAVQLTLFMNPPDANRQVRTHVSGHGTDQDGQAMGGGFSGGSNTRHQGNTGNGRNPQPSRTCPSCRGKARYPHANCPPTRSPMAQQRTTAPQ